METKQDERLHARNLYFGTNLSQQEIADQCNINRKTLYLWMNEGGWRHAKYAAAHAPTLLIDQYYEQLGKLNQHIASRENPWPTKDEANIMRRIMLCITQFKNHGGVIQTTNVFHDFIEYLRVSENNLPMAQEYIKPMDRYVKKMIDDSTWLNYNTIAAEEQHFRNEHADWLKTQKEEQPNVILSPSKDDVILNSPKDVTPPPAKPRPLTYEEVKQKVEAIDRRKQQTAQTNNTTQQSNSNNVIGSSSKNPNKSTPPPPGGSRREGAKLGEGLPIPHPRLPRYLNTNDIQKMMETPQPGQHQNNFNPKRY